MYPNNSFKPLVYDLNERKVVTIADKKELLKTYKKSDIIDKYNKEGEVKIGKTWYIFGGHLGGGIHPLYVEGNYNIDCYLMSIDGQRIFTANGFKSLGYFYNNKSQVITKTGETLWVNQNGTKVSDAIDEAANYTGNTKLTKLQNGSYQLVKDDMIILGDKKLEKITDYLKKNAKIE